MLIIFLKFRTNRLSGYETSAILVKCVWALFPCQLSSPVRRGLLETWWGEAAGGPGEWWQCHHVLAHGHIHTLVTFFRSKIGIKLMTLHIFSLGWSISIVGTVI